MIVVFIPYERAPEVFCATAAEIIIRATATVGGSPHAAPHPPGAPLSKLTMAWNVLTRGLKDARLFDDTAAALAHFEGLDARVTATERLAVIAAIARLSCEPDSLLSDQTR